MKKNKFCGLQFSFSKQSIRLYYLDLNKPIPEIKTQIKTDISFHERPIELENLKPSIVEDRIANGHKIFVAYHLSKPIAYLFAADKDCWVSEIEDRLILGAGEVYLYDAYTYSKFRGKHIYPFLIYNAAKYFKKLSYSKALISSTTANTASIRGIEKAGFSYSQTIDFLNIFGWKFWNYVKGTNNVESRFSNEI